MFLMSLYIFTGRLRVFRHLLSVLWTRRGNRHVESLGQSEPWTGPAGPLQRDCGQTCEPGETVTVRSVRGGEATPGRRQNKAASGRPRKEDSPDSAVVIRPAVFI